MLSGDQTFDAGLCEEHPLSSIKRVLFQREGRQPSPSGPGDAVSPGYEAALRGVRAAVEEMLSRRSRIVEPSAPAALLAARARTNALLPMKAALRISALLANRTRSLGWELVRGL